RMLASAVGLSTTITSSGLLDEALTKPQVPSASTTRTPLTVTRSRIFWPATGSPEAAAALYWAVILSTIEYFTSSAQCGDMVGEPQVLGSAFLRSASDLPGARSSMSHTAIAATKPSSYPRPSGGWKKKWPDFSKPTSA